MKWKNTLVSITLTALSISSVASMEIESNLKVTTLTLKNENVRLGSTPFISYPDLSLKNKETTLVTIPIPKLGETTNISVFEEYINNDLSIELWDSSSMSVLQCPRLGSMIKDTSEPLEISLVRTLTSLDYGRRWLVHFKIESKKNEITSTDTLPNSIANVPNLITLIPETIIATDDENDVMIF